MRLSLIFILLLAVCQSQATDYISLGKQTGFKGQTGWAEWELESIPPPGVEYRPDTAHDNENTNLTGIVTIPNVVQAGNYRCWVKGSSRNTTIQAPTGIYTINFGGGPVSVTGNDKDPDGYWHYMGPVTVTVATNKFPVTISRVSSLTLNNSMSFIGLYLTTETNANYIVTSDDYGQLWQFPTVVDANAPVSGNYLLNSGFENGVGDYAFYPTEGKWYDTGDMWSADNAHSGARSLRMNTRNCVQVRSQNDNYLRTRPILVRANKAHSASVWAKSVPAGAVVTLNIRSCVALPTGFGLTVPTNYTSGAFTLSNTNWTQISMANHVLVGYPDPAQYFIEVKVFSPLNPLNNDVWLDDLWFGEGATVPAWAPALPLELQLRNSKLGGRYNVGANESKIVFSVANNTGASSLETITYEIYDGHLLRVTNSTLNLTCNANANSEVLLDVESLSPGPYRIVGWLSNGSESEIYFSRLPVARTIAPLSSIFGGHLEAKWYQGQLNDSMGWTRVFSPNGALRWDVIETSPGVYNWLDGLANRTFALGKASLVNLYQKHATWANRDYIRLTSVSGPGFNIGNHIVQSSSGAHGTITWAGTVSDVTGDALQLSNVFGGTFITGGGILNEDNGSTAMQNGAVVGATPDLIRYTNFVHQVVARYKDNVKYWELGNEPQLDSSIPKPVGFEYNFWAQLSRMAAQAVKAQCPDCNLIALGGVNTAEQGDAILNLFPLSVLTNIYAISYHIYDTDGEAAGVNGGLTTRASDFIDLAANYGIAQVWHSEAGVYSKSQYYGNRANWRNNGTALLQYRDCEDQLSNWQLQNDWTAVNLLFTIGSGTAKHFRYDARDGHHLGEPNGSPNSYSGQPTEIDINECLKPTGTVDRFLRSALEGGVGHGRIPTPTHTFSYAFTGFGGTPWASLTDSQILTTATNRLLTFPAGLTSSGYQVFDVYGTQLSPASGTVAYGKSPVMIKAIGATSLAALTNAIAGGTDTTLADTVAPNLVIAEYPKVTTDALRKHRVRIRWLAWDTDYLCNGNIDGNSFRNKLDAAAFSDWTQLSFLELTGLSSGVHSFTVEARDRALNTTSKTITFNVP
jgi:hypothetical protein